MNILEISKSSSAITEFSFFFGIFFVGFRFFRQCSTTSEVCATRNNRQGGVRRPFRAAPLWVSLSIRIAADFHRTTVATAPGRKTPHGAPPYEKLDPVAIFFSVSLFCAEHYICSYENQQKLLSPELHFLTPIYTKSFARWGFAPDPLGELMALPQTS